MRQSCVVPPGLFKLYGLESEPCSTSLQAFSYFLEAFIYSVFGKEQIERHYPTSSFTPNSPIGVFHAPMEATFDVRFPQSSLKSHHGPVCATFQVPRNTSKTSVAARMTSISPEKE